MEVVYGGSSSINPLLNDIKTYLGYIYGNTDLLLDYASDDYILLYNINQAVQYIKDNLSSYDDVLQDISDTLDDIETEMETINTFLNDTSFNSSTITGNLPSNANITSPTDSIVSSFFTSLQTVFTSDEALDIVLPIPFAPNNQTITIPSNYTETYLPSALKIFIRSFYWFAVSRWIILSLVNLVNKIRNLSFIENTDNR